LKGISVRRIYYRILKTVLVTRRTLKLNIDKLKILVFKGVFNPKLSVSTILLSKHVPSPMRGGVSTRMVEVGSGSGVIALVAAMKGWDVVASDVDVVSTYNTLYNSKMNRLNAKMNVTCADLLSHIRSSSLALVVSNPPYMPCRRTSYNDPICAGEQLELIQALLREAYRVLKDNGVLLLCLGKDSIDTVLKFMSELGLKTEIVDRKGVVLDEIYVVKAIKKR